MSDAEKKYEPLLKKAIEKAINNGYEHHWLFPFTTPTLKGKVQQVYDDECCDREGAFGFDESLARAFIFSHKFAKAFFGDDPYDTGLLISDDTPEDDRYGKDYDGREYLVLPAWQFHLQQMVVEENPIKYLEAFI